MQLKLGIMAVSPAETSSWGTTDFTDPEAVHGNCSYRLGSPRWCLLVNMGLAQDTVLVADQLWGDQPVRSDPMEAASNSTQPSSTPNT
jgi:hypothetical protein